MKTQPLRTIQQLSERAKIIIHHMLDERSSPASIVRYVSRITHEKISVEAVEAYAKEYAVKVLAKEDARYAATDITARLIRNGVEVSDMLYAAFHEAYALAKKTKALAEMDPLLFEAAERRRQELDLKRKQVSLAERRVQILEKRLRFDRKKAQAVVNKLDRKARRGQSLTSEEVRRIREIYGIYDATDQDARAEQRESRQLEQAATKR